jgi:toxin ParE1/3/4
MQVTWTPSALSHLEEIADYLAQRNPSAAHRVVNAIYSQTQTLLSENPMIGRRGRDPETRELVITNTPYIVAYRVTERVEILAVIHGARRWPERFE